MGSLTDGATRMGMGIAGGIEKRRDRKDERKRITTRLGTLDEYKDRTDELEELSLRELQALDDEDAFKRAKAREDAEMANLLQNTQLGAQEYGYRDLVNPQRVEQEGLRTDSLRQALEETTAGQNDRLALLNGQSRVVGAQANQLEGEQLRQKNMSAAIRALLENANDEELAAVKQLSAAGGDVPLDLLRTYLEPGFKPQFSQGPSGAVAMTTSKKSAVPVRSDAGDKPALEKLEIGGKTYFVGPGNRYFDEEGVPVEFGGGMGGGGMLFGADGKLKSADEKPPLSEEDRQAIEWAKANPQDPRAATILKKHGT